MSNRDDDRVKYRKYKSKYLGAKNKGLACTKRASFSEFINSKPIRRFHGIIDEVKAKEFPVLVTLDDIKYHMEYSNVGVDFKTNLHIGQRKLFMNELQFLTHHLDSKNSMCYVIYAGAAPSNHIYKLHEYFPNIKFILVDPAQFNIYLHNSHMTHLNTANDGIVYLKYDKNNSKLSLDPSKVNFYDGTTNDVVRRMVVSNEYNNKMRKFIEESNYKIFIIQDYYTDALSELFSKLSDTVFFFSDIRTGLLGEESPTDLDILWNSAQQLNWVNILKPSALMVKFRCPYYMDFRGKTEDEIRNIIAKSSDGSIERALNYGVDFIKNYMKRKMVYFTGSIYIQPWGPVTTTEVRIVSDDYTKMTEYPCLEAEEKFFYFNNIDRTIVNHVNPYANRSIGFDHCNDCALEALIWDEYARKFGGIDVITEVKGLTSLLGKSLKQGGHGFLFELFSAKWYDSLYKMICSNGRNNYSRAFGDY